jgi:hypothetical protein
MPKLQFPIPGFQPFEHSGFGFVSNFEFRISDLCSLWRHDPKVRNRLLTVLMVAVIACSAARASAADAFANAAKLRSKYLADIEELARWCDENRLPDEARKTRHAVRPHDPDKLYLPVLPAEVGSAKPPADASPIAADWHVRFGRLRHSYAVATYEIARHAVAAGRTAMAFELVLAAVEADPDYEPVRRLLGYQKYRDQWRTSFEARKLRTGLAWSEKFGWLTKTHLRRYEDGQRYCDGRWITAAEDAQRHHDIRSGWLYETEHYAIRTDHSLEAAVALGVKLERLYRLWAEIFIRYYASEGDVVALFDGRNRAQVAHPRRHDIVYLRDREDYNLVLKNIYERSHRPVPSYPTEGIYIDGAAYFFPSQGGDDRTLYHEATHQLFHESRKVAQEVGGKANFWIIEGIAMYMESLRQEDGYYVLGGFQDERLNAAQFRLLHDKFYVPLSEFTAYGATRFQSDPRIATLYSQAAGLTNFLVYYRDGRNRDALVQYLSTVYDGKDDANTLARLTGANYNDLDKQYREFLVQGGGRKAEGRPSFLRPPNSALNQPLATSH